MKTLGKRLFLGENGGEGAPTPFRQTTHEALCKRCLCIAHKLELLPPWDPLLRMLAFQNRMQQTSSTVLFLFHDLPLAWVRLQSQKSAEQTHTAHARTYAGDPGETFTKMISKMLGVARICVSGKIKRQTELA